MTSVDDALAKMQISAYNDGYADGNEACRAEIERLSDAYDICANSRDYALVRISELEGALKKIAEKEIRTEDGYYTGWKEIARAALRALSPVEK